MKIRRAALALALASAACAQLLVSVPSSIVNDYETQSSVAAGATATIQSQSASGKRLLGFEVWSSVAHKDLVYTINGGSTSSSPVIVSGAPAYQVDAYKVPDPNIAVLGSAGGTNAFQISVTNLDANATADISVTFHYSN